MGWTDDATPNALWIDQIGLGVESRPALPGDTDADLAIIGAGFSGLWTAYYALAADPSLRVVVVDKHHCGFGASGRNGGWAVGELACGPDKYADRSTPSEARRLERAVFDAVDEIGRVSQTEGIDCDYAKGGWIRVARNRPQADRQRGEVAHEHARGLTADDLRLLDPTEARQYLNATDVESGIYFAHCAAVHPAKLVDGLARTVEARGAHIHEHTEVLELAPGRVVTDRGTVRAANIVLATEAYTRDLAGHRRDLLPVYSLMVATEPLGPSTISQIGLADRPTFSDDRHMVIYGQRTADDRLAFGGRGVPYLFGSGISRQAELHAESHERLRQTLVEMFPVLAEVEFTHRWGGVLAIPRDWVPGLRFDPSSGLGVLGGYVGEGVAAANLAGRTMADLVTGAKTDRVTLPWVGVHPRRWEPEPLRWLGVRASRAILGRADDREYATGRPANAAYKISRLLRGA